MVEGIKNLTLSKVEFCESCMNGKLTRLPFKGKNNKKTIKKQKIKNKKTIIR